MNTNWQSWTLGWSPRDMATIASGFGTDCNRHGQRFQTNEMPGLVLPLHHLTTILWFWIVLFFCNPPSWPPMVCNVVSSDYGACMISGNIMGCASSPPPPTPLHPPSHLHHHHCGDHVVFVTILTTSFFTELKKVADTAHRHWYEILKYKYTNTPQMWWWCREGNGGRDWA